MKIAICAIAKNEKYYINDWVSYHINIGIDHIYLYDNEDLDSKVHYEDYIDVKFKDCVTIVDARGKNRYQWGAYNDCYRSHKNEYDWIAFIDCDEFITIVDKTKTIKDIISDGFEKYDCIKVSWMVFSDDNDLYGNLNIPVYERMDSCKRKDKYNVSKSIVNCKSDSLHIGIHEPQRFGGSISQITPSKQISQTIGKYGESSEPSDFSCMFLRHYHVKTAAEYKVQKMYRPDAIAPTSRNSVDFFFHFNPRTDERLHILNDIPVDEIRQKLEDNWTNRPERVISSVNDRKDEPQLIVSLTSYPHRFCDPQFMENLKSLVNQKTDVRYKIVLSLFKDDIPLLPQMIKQFCDSNNIDILSCDLDIKSHKKYFYVMKKYCHLPVMTVDDDVVYRSEMVDDMYKCHLKNNDTIICGCAMEIEVDDCGNFGNRICGRCQKHNFKSDCICLIGSGGVFYPSKFCKSIDDRLMKIIPYWTDDDMLLFIIRKSLNLDIMLSSASFEVDDTKIYWAGYFTKYTLPINHDEFDMYKSKSHTYWRYVQFYNCKSVDELCDCVLKVKDKLTKYI